jgi:hypothetical protein
MVMTSYTLRLVCPLLLVLQLLRQSWLAFKESRSLPATAPAQRRCTMQQQEAGGLLWRCCGRCVVLHSTLLIKQAAQRCIWHVQAAMLVLRGV